jgi:hypothetical protein
MREHVFKWIPDEKVMAGFYELKYIKDDFDSLCVCLDNQEQVIILNWDGIVESYCRTTEEGRFAFIADEWQKIKKCFPDWAFFLMRKSDYREWFYSEYGDFAEEDEFTHYMIVTDNFVIDVISAFEPIVTISKNITE